MQIDYNQYIVELQREVREAKAKFEASARRPCMAERYGRWEGLSAAMDYVIVMTKDTTNVKTISERLSSLFEEKIRHSIGLVRDYRYPWDQRYAFGRAMGFYIAYNLLREHAARTMHVEEITHERDT